jgi:zinc transporter 1/2/3
MFGTGVIAATAWCHLLPESFAAFGSKCLEGSGWEKYGGFVGVFAMIAAFGAQVLEVIAHGPPSEHGHSHSHGTEMTVVSKPAATVDVGDAAQDAEASAKVSVDVSTPESPESPAAAAVGQCQDHVTGGMTPSAIMALEASILVHSVIIGITLGVMEQEKFGAFLVAICFHQLFEGGALGALIAGAKFPAVPRLVLSIMYPLTTPLGMVIGIGARNTYNASSVTSIVVIGILESMCSGLLMYNTYAELMSSEINHNPKFHAKSVSMRTWSLIAMYLGAGAMAVIALWA